MAYRLLNCSAHALRVDLRGSETLLLDAGALSPVLREELLYDNVFVAQWQQQGLLRRVPASLGEADDAPAPAPRTARKAAPKAAATPRKTPSAKSKSTKGAEA